MLPRFRTQQRSTHRRALDNVPYVFNSIAELSACYTGTQAVVADGDGVVNELVCEVVLALGHSANKDTDTLLRS